MQAALQPVKFWPWMGPECNVIQIIILLINIIFFGHGTTGGHHEPMFVQWIVVIPMSNFCMYLGVILYYSLHVWTLEDAEKIPTIKFSSKCNKLFCNTKLLFCVVVCWVQDYSTQEIIWQHPRNEIHRPLLRLCTFGSSKRKKFSVLSTKFSLFELEKILTWSMLRNGFSSLQGLMSLACSE